MRRSIVQDESKGMSRLQKMSRRDMSHGMKGVVRRKSSVPMVTAYDHDRLAIRAWVVCC